jgi:uncharacterized cupredoxin-like copper-binding protein
VRRRSAPQHPLVRRPSVLAVMGLIFLTGCARAAPERHDPPLRAMRTVHVSIKWSSFHPSRFTFPEGTTVRFVIRNEDPIEHEFILGSKRVQDYIEHTAHPDHDGSVPGQITVPPGTERTTTYRFARAGEVLLGCHLPGHYAFGMRGAVTVEL